ncbi:MULTISPECIES: hypothetical protein [Pseudomonas]|uniref:Uncharacterized protein n=1 Tax=Pseudomonas cedrina TaxID=651740 RepID=A0A2S9DA62_PSECE|nr:MULTISPECIES: hypothetical protein [Pseudomonas]AVJ22702.1 hypothetical protein CLM72_13540 [Pseudomonas sp. MYb193]PRB94118.1 hypothetical protein CQ006_23660 [Pseudomonas cedrina]
MARHLYRRPSLTPNLPVVDIPLMHPPIEGDIENADGGIGVSHTMRPLVVHIDRPDGTPEGTLFELYWGPGNPVAFNLIREGDEHLTRIPFTVPFDSIREPWADPVQVLVICGSDDNSQTAPLRLRVNLQHPGGEDLNPAPGNQNLMLELPEDVRLEGVNDERAKLGVEIICRHWSNMAAYDLLIVVWGSARIERLIQPDEVGRDIVCFVGYEAIQDAGDSELLPVAFQVQGPTGNMPDPWALWSTTALVSVYLETDRLGAAWVQFPETDREIDLEVLGTRDVEVGLAVSAADARAYSQIFFYWNGKSHQGGSVSHFEDRPLAGGKGYTFKIENHLVHAIAQGSAVVYYELTGASAGVPDKRSHNLYLSVIGEIVRWPAPTVDQALGGVLKPDLPLITIRFPAQTSWASSDRLQVIILAADAEGTVDYIAGRAVGEISPGEEMTFDVSGTELARFDGRQIEVLYSVTRGSEQPQESLRQVYQVGEPIRDMPAPEVDKAQGNQLDPDDVVNGANVKAPFSETQAGDGLTLYWYSRVSAPPIPFNVDTDGQVAVFPVPYKYIGPNEDEWVSAFYTLERDGKKRYSAITDLLISRGLVDLPVPVLRHASITGPETATLAPMNVLQGSKLVVSYTGMADTDFIQPKMIGTTGTGSPAIPGKPGNAAAGSVEFDIASLAFAANVGNADRTFTLEYVVTRNDVGWPSKVLRVTVTPIPQAELAKTVLKINQANAATQVLDLTTFTGDATGHIGVWPFMTAPYPVWLRLLGKTDKGVDHSLTVYNGAGSAAVNPTWIANGKIEPGIARSYLNGLGDGTKLQMELKAAVSTSKDETLAISFPIVEYKVINKPLPIEIEFTKFDDKTLNGWRAVNAGIYGFSAQAGGYYLWLVNSGVSAEFGLEKIYTGNQFSAGQKYEFSSDLAYDQSANFYGVALIFSGNNRIAMEDILANNYWKKLVVEFVPPESSNVYPLRVMILSKTLSGMKFFVDNIRIRRV